MKKLNQTGATHLVAVLAVVVIGVVAFAAYRVSQSGTNSNGSDTAAVTSGSKAIPAKFTSKADLNTASSALNSDQADKSLDPSQLDGDINTLL